MCSSAHGSASSCAVPHRVPQVVVQFRAGLRKQLCKGLCPRGFFCFPKIDFSINIYFFRCSSPRLALFIIIRGLWQRTPTRTPAPCTQQPSATCRRRQPARPQQGRRGSRAQPPPPRPQRTAAGTAGIQQPEFSSRYSAAGTAGTACTATAPSRHARASRGPTT